MGSGAVIYVPSFIKIGSGMQKPIGGYTDTHTRTATILVVLFVIFREGAKEENTILK
jgi:hypothetical protein